VTDTHPTRKPRFTATKTVRVLIGVIVAAVTALAVLSINTARLNGEVEKGNASIAQLQADVGFLSASLTKTTADKDRYVQIADAATGREAKITAREAEVAAKELAVTERESAVAATETHIQETTLKDGMYYTVGTSMQAGTYQTTSTSSRCYWSITQSGTNYDDIVENDLGGMGVLSVSIAAGQDFQSKGCSDWTKVG